MKHLPINFEDLEFQRLKEKKLASSMTWKQFVMQLAEDKDAQEKIM